MAASHMVLGAELARDRSAVGKLGRALRDNREAHVWLVDAQVLAEAEGMEPRFAECLSRQELERAAAYGSPRDRAFFVARRVALRRLLAQYLDAAPAEIEIEAGRYGKPLLGGNFANRLAFSIAHREGIAAIALTAGDPVGVDLEVNVPVPNVDEMADEYFSEAERRQFAQIPAQDRSQVFLKQWTRKEALAKAIGSGLSLPFHEFTIPMLGAPDRAEGFDVGGCMTPWNILDADCEHGSFISVAVRGTDWRVFNAGRMLPE